MGRYKGIVTHGAKPTAEDLITIKFFESYPQLPSEYWSQVEVAYGDEIGRIDILFKTEEGDYIVVEVKSSADRIDEAIGQILRYSYLLAKQFDYSGINLQKWIVTPDSYLSHIEICEQLGIRLVGV